MNEPTTTASSAIEKYFFTPIYYPNGAISVVKWWESRRLLYNVSVGAAGLTTLGVILLLGMGEGPPPGFVIVYGLAANVLYSLGAPADLLLRRWLGERAAPAGPTIFRYGFVFSVGLTLLPIPLVIFGSIMRFLFGS